MQRKSSHSQQEDNLVKINTFNMISNSTTFQLFAKQLSIRSEDQTIRKLANKFLQEKAKYLKYIENNLYEKVDYQFYLPAQQQQITIKNQKQIKQFEKKIKQFFYKISEQKKIIRKQKFLQQQYKKLMSIIQNYQGNQQLFQELKISIQNEICNLNQSIENLNLENHQLEQMIKKKKTKKNQSINLIKFEQNLILQLIKEQEIIFEKNKEKIKEINMKLNEVENLEKINKHLKEAIDFEKKQKKQPNWASISERRKNIRKRSVLEISQRSEKSNILLPKQKKYSTNYQRNNLIVNFILIILFTAILGRIIFKWFY